MMIWITRSPNSIALSRVGTLPIPTDHGGIPLRQTRSEKLAKKCACRDDHRIRPGKAVDRREWSIQYDLKCVPSMGLRLEVSERIRELSASVLDLDKEPRFAVSYDLEIDFALQLVA